MCIFYLRPSSYYIDNIFFSIPCILILILLKELFLHLLLLRAVFVVDIVISLENTFICTFWVGHSRNPLSMIKAGKSRKLRVLDKRKLNEIHVFRIKQFYWNGVIQSVD